ncbi:hypothetical protein BDZ91DRAFT_716550 [Kalaharituber pfeilii]|nr:hypothetical protein BDZ91DRAFT_716550 [Kalaharituber pfeilii]
MILPLHHDIDNALYHYYGRAQPSQYPHSRPIIGNWNRITDKPTASFGRSTLFVVLTFWVG